MSGAPGALGPGELALLEAGVAENPGSRLFLRLAGAYALDERLDQAAAVLERGLGLHPQEVEARGLLAQVLSRQGRRAQALEHLWQAVRELARQAGVFDLLADLMAQEGGQQTAQAARRLGQDLRDLAESPPPPAPRTAAAPQDTPTMAEIYAAQGHADKATQIYGRLLAAEPGRADYAQRLAQLSGRDPEPEAASTALLAGLEALEAAAISRSSSVQAGEAAALGPLRALLGAALARTGAAGA